MTDHSPLRSAWTDSLARGEQPDAAALRSHLHAIHTDHAGFTETCAQACRDNAGRTSYEWLAEVVAHRPRGRILDLACGSGVLLEMLHAQNRQLSLTGVDMCPEELALAAARLPEGAADLLRAEAQDLSGLVDASVDTVLCHWALTLMDPIEPVLREVRRVLKPGGTFAAVVDGPMHAAPGYTEVHALIYGHVQAEVPGYGEIDLGDPRVRGSDSLSDLVRKVFEDATVTVEPEVVVMRGPAAAVAESVAGFFYAAFTLSAMRRSRMLTELAMLLAAPNTEVTKDTEVTFSMPINRLVVSR